MNSVPPPPMDDLSLPHIMTEDPAEIDTVESAPLASHAENVAQLAASPNFMPSKFTGNLSSSSVHAFSRAEKAAFVKHINEVLVSDSDLSDKLPINPDSNDIFDVVRDGILLCKLINASVPGSIDASKIITHFRDEKSKTYHIIVNQNLVVYGAKKMGAIVVNMGAEDLMEGKPYLVFGLLWQIIKIGMLKEVTLDKHPELANMSEEDLSKLPPEELLLKWFNWHLAKSGYNEPVASFASLVDSSSYIRLMHHLAPDLCSLDALEETDLLKRAELMLADAQKLGVKSVVTPHDIVQGNEKLNLVFTAEMFNKQIGMIPITEAMEKENEALQEEKAALQTQVQKLETTITDFQVSKSETERVLAEAAAKNEKLMQELESVKNKGSSLEDAISNVKGDNEKLLEEAESLAAEKAALKKAIDDYKHELSLTMEELQRERISLETSEFCGASLASDLESLRSKHEKLEYLIEHLKIERMRSDMHVERLRILYNSFPTTEALCDAIYPDATLEVLSRTASKTGYLTKKARNGSSWKYRYFVLRDNFLFYFKSDKDPNAKFSGVIRVDDAVIKFAENPTRRDLKDQWLLAIEVPNNNDVIKQHSFYISGEDHELEGWKTQIKLAAGWWTKRSRVKLGI